MTSTTFRWSRVSRLLISGGHFESTDKLAFTVAMTITPSDSSCPVGSCGVDADPLKHCDARLAWPKGSNQICAYYLYL